MILLLIGSGVCALPTGAAQTTQTQIDSSAVNSSLQSATAAVEQAFNALQDAEAAGANITQLSTQLNQAAALLAQAQNANATGDIATALSSSADATTIATSVTATAQHEAELAAASSQNQKTATIVASAVGIAVFGVVLFWVWRQFKNSYAKSLSQAKPEVASDET